MREASRRSPEQAGYGHHFAQAVMNMDWRDVATGMRYWPTPETRCNVAIESVNARGGG